MMEYKGYTGRITAVDEKQQLISGQVVGLKDVITFEGKTIDEFITAFHESVDDYLEFCAELKQTPEKPYSGKFLVRIPPELHQKAALAAKRAGESLNAWVADAMREHLGKAPAQSARQDSGRTPARRSRKGA